MNCIKCKTKKRKSHFNARYCESCSHDSLLESNRRWRVSHRDAERKKNRERMLRYRMEVLEHYGGIPPECKCCGETTYEFLSIDHINGGGNKHAKTYKGRLSTWLNLHGFPKGFQVLCHNCNQAKGHYGQCPHKK